MGAGCSPTNGRSRVEAAFEYRTWENPLIPCVTIMSNNSKEHLDFKYPLYLMTAINGSLGLRVRANMFKQLVIILTEQWIRIYGWTTGRNK